MIEKDTILVRNEYDGGEVKFKRQIQKFSIILCGQLGSHDSIYTIPKFIRIQTPYIQIIRCFAQIHEYNPKQVQTPKSERTLYNQLCTESTLKFIQSHLVSMPDQKIRQLYSTCNYFNIETLNRVICLYILERYRLPESDQEAEKKLIQYGVNNIGQNGVLDIKERYLQYFQIYGERISRDVEQLKEKI